MSKTSEIQDELSYLERFEDMGILFAVEAGSRAWGFESTDSDYDIRFVYKRNVPYYLRLDKQPDTLEWRNGDLDMAGWDLGKFLRLTRDSNPSAFEWLYSPIVYREDADWDLVRRLADRCFDPVSTVWHHIGMAKSTMKTHLHGDSVPAKRYLYVVRSILAAKYAVRHFKPVPVPFVELFQDQRLGLSDGISDIVERLLERKRSVKEDGECPRDAVLEGWFDSSLSGLEDEVRKYRHREKVEWSELNCVFLDALGLLP